MRKKKNHCKAYSDFDACKKYHRGNKGEIVNCIPSMILLMVNNVDTGGDICFLFGAKQLPNFVF